jgi:hypothetical protein
MFFPKASGSNLMRQKIVFPEDLAAMEKFYGVQKAPTHLRRYRS